MEDSWTFLRLAFLLFYIQLDHSRTSAAKRYTHKSHLGSHVTKPDESDSLLEDGKERKAKGGSVLVPSPSPPSFSLLYLDIYIHEAELLDSTVEKKGYWAP